MAEGENPKLVGQQFKKEPSGGSLIPMGGVSGGLTPDIINEINFQQKTGNFRKIAGRPWWTSVYTSEELKKAGLI